MARLIKRYDNRKLYDTEGKRYVSLEDIAALVRAGEEVEVTDNTTGDDLTAQTLAKVILEANAGRGLPQAQFLHEILRAGGKAVAVSVSQLERGLDKLVEASLDRMKSVREVREEMARIRKDVVRLEKAIDALSAEKEHGNDTDKSGK
jgi:polyhydroxyalkanoate synthesis repressor PhaR